MRRSPWRLGALAAALLAGCSSIPPLEEWERFEVTAGPHEKPNFCLVTVKAKNLPPPPIGHVLVGLPGIDEGEATLEIKGWRGARDPREAEGILQMEVQYRGKQFRFVLLDRGHRDEYTIATPSSGTFTIEPASGEFSERG